MFLQGSILRKSSFSHTAESVNASCPRGGCSIPADTHSQGQAGPSHTFSFPQDSLKGRWSRAGNEDSISHTLQNQIKLKKKRREEGKEGNKMKLQCNIKELHILSSLGEDKNSLFISTLKFIAISRKGICT